PSAATYSFPLSLHDALPISFARARCTRRESADRSGGPRSSLRRNRHEPVGRSRLALRGGVLARNESHAIAAPSTKRRALCERTAPCDRPFRNRRCGPEEGNRTYARRHFASPCRAQCPLDVERLLPRRREFHLRAGHGRRDRIAAGVPVCASRCGALRLRGRDHVAPLPSGRPALRDPARERLCPRAARARRRPAANAASSLWARAPLRAWAAP